MATPANGQVFDKMVHASRNLGVEEDVCLRRHVEDRIVHARPRA
jgi:hypothetical protein